MGKKKTNKFWAYVKEMTIHTIAPLLMYMVASSVLLMVMAKQGEEIDISKIVMWDVGCTLVAAAYNGLLLWNIGGSHYEMLVSGNMKRISAYENGYEMNIGGYHYEKEYRPWKGFVIGAIMSILVIVGSIILGANQEALKGTDEISRGLTIVLLIFDFIVGWAILPFQIANRSGIAVNCYLGIILALVPIIFSGVFYIVGAYSKRNKTIRKQEQEAKIRETEQNKPKKINYGGLPGTKPKKRK